jgi:hypothetical protein
MAVAHASKLQQNRARVEEFHVLDARIVSNESTRNEYCSRSREAHDDDWIPDPVLLKPFF